MCKTEQYRKRVRTTFQQFSDQALAFHDARIVGGIDREECDREIKRRRSRVPGSTAHEQLLANVLEPIARAEDLARRIGAEQDDIGAEQLADDLYALGCYLGGGAVR